ncbi:SusC/RagA family TonB-linked outer membrane protein [Pontibacter cellulosilyticus]|uniref:TonB-dependent receptor n=1 Tax=Pontibacter cellulosilyticus TaxID=1720253 RepID=A0A923SJG5_9BACT|nr:TonB-dependent receptor [Pontibacter cellulosilyticus]MBC5993637.1 TonB-dependent receptor [Pontibacter cellulosilyticus]
MKKILLLCFVLMLALLHQSIAQDRPVTGKVVDAQSDQGLPGVTVVVKGTSTGITTDAFGNFSITVPETNPVLVVSYIGYTRQEVPVGAQSNITVRLQQDNQQLSEVVVLGYSEQTKQKLISSVSVVESQQLETVPLADVNQIIQGRAPGVLSTVGSGQPGAAANIRIRGTGSIDAGRGPLYVIDGVIIESGDFTRNTPTADLLSTISPSDIESISILKDAAATALYGSRAANGVVLISTKRGKAGKTQFTLRTQYGQTIPNHGDFDVLNSQQLTEYDREGLRNLGLSEATVLRLRPDRDVDTDWIDAAFRNGTTQSYDLSAAGGNENLRFFFSGGYFNQEGILIGSEFSRYSTRFNLDNNPSSRFSWGANLNISYTDQLSASPGNQFNSPLLGSYTMLPWDRISDPVTGELLVGREFESFTQDNFVRSTGLNPTVTNTLRGIGNARGRFEIIPNQLSYKLVLGVDYTGIDEDDFTDPTTPDGFDSQGRKTNIFSRNITLTAQNLLNYAKTFGEAHNFTALVGYEAQRFERDGFDVSGTGFASGRLTNLGTAATAESIGGTATDYYFLSYLSQINYDYQNKYFFTGSFRRDGSSRFGANNRWANFGAVGLSWIVTNESFLSGTDFLSNLKLRLSYGITGNADIGNFASRGLYSFTAAYNGLPASLPSQLENADLTWEKNRTFNAGLDFGLFERVNASVDYYIRSSDDLLLQVPISSTSGFTTFIQNVGEVENKGLEIVISSQNLTGGFAWTTDFNIAGNRNKVKKLTGGQDIPNGTQVIREGEPIRSFYLRDYEGVDPQTGRPLWKDGEGGVTGSYNAAPRMIVGNAEPDFYGGLNNTFKWKGIELSAFIYFIEGNDIYNQTSQILDSDGLRYGFNQSDVVLDHWRQPGDISMRPFPIAGSGNNNAHGTSTRYLEDGSYIRLRNVVLSYNLPKPFISKAGLSSVRVYLQGQNLVTITDYTGFDPELAENGTEFFRYPNGRIATFGVDFGF